jgi:phosphate transport system substrate-binding protein
MRLVSIRFRALTACVLAAGLALASTRGAAAEAQLRLSGSNTLGAKLAPALAEAWLRDEGYAVVVREQPAENETTLLAQREGESLRVSLHAHGTTRGFDDLIAGRADLGLASRPVSDAERQRAAALGALDSAEQEAVVALDGVAVIVHPSNPLRSLTRAQLRAVFGGEVRDWSALGLPAAPIAWHARDDQSGTWETFRTLVLEGHELVRGARRYESSAALAAAVAADPHAIGFVGVSAVGAARALAIADAGPALEPTPASVAVEDYALARRLFVYRARDASPRARRFVAFALSDAGQHVVEQTGFVAQRIRAYAVVPPRGAPREYVELVRGGQRLSVNFRFGAGSRMLDGKLQHDIARLAEFMRRPEQRAAPLLLLGFADASETSSYLALTLSNDRVDLIARLLEAHGVGAARSRGLGGALPVADNATASGRLRNRRVEVWIGAGEARVALGASDRGGIARQHDAIDAPR